MSWNESQHPRTADGEFTSGSGTAAGKKTPSAADKHRAKIEQYRQLARDHKNNPALKDHYERKAAELQKKLAKSPAAPRAAAAAKPKPQPAQTPKPEHEKQVSAPTEQVTPDAQARHAKDLVLGYRRNVFDEKGIQFKGAVAKAFGLPLEQDADRAARLMQAHEKTKAYRDPKKKELKGAREIVAKHLALGAEKHVETVKAVARASQAAHEEEHVTVYRGITGVQAKALIEAHRSGRPLEVKVDTTSSFTDDHEIATSFAKNGSTRRVESPHAVVIKVTVPRSSIVASHRALPELRAEREVVLASHGAFTVNPEHFQIIKGDDGSVAVP